MGMNRHHTPPVHLRPDSKVDDRDRHLIEVLADPAMAFAEDLPPPDSPPQQTVCGNTSRSDHPVRG